MWTRSLPCDLYKVQSIVSKIRPLVRSIGKGICNSWYPKAQKKFSTRALFSLMEEVHYLPMNDAYKKFEATFDTWKQNTEQIDDVYRIFENNEIKRPY